MSCMVAPPVARQGLPRKPWMKRRTRRPAKDLARAVGIERMKKREKVTA